MKQDFNGKTILVLGGCGFIGSNFIRHVLGAYEGVRIVNYDALTYSGNPENLRDVQKLPTSQYLFIKGDIADDKMLDTYYQNEKPDYVINFAAETHVDRSIHVGAKQFIDTNVTGVFNILECVKKYGAVKYVQVSTDEVYGQLPNPHDQEMESQKQWASMQRFDRRTAFRPNVPYSATKAAGDCLCNAYHHTWHVPVVVTHCTNNYGPYQYPEKLIPFFASRLIRGEKVPVYGDGMNIRDWIHVDDHVRALVLCLLKGEPGQTYNIGADNEKNNKEIAASIVQAIHGAVDPEDYFEYVVDRPGHDRRYAIDASDIKNELGWVCEYGADKFEEKLKETIEWYKNNQEWVNNVITKTGVANPHIDLWKAHDLNKK